jgi:hypothetical protein
MTETNPLFDGTLSVTVGGHDFTAALLPGLSYSNTNPGGFGECTFRIEASSPYVAYVRDGHTMAKGDAVVIAHGSTPVTLFQGTITNDLSRAVIEDGQAYYEVTAAGLWWRAGLRKDFCKTWADDDTSKWFERETGGPWIVNTEGKVEIRLEDGQSLKAGSSKSLYYWLDEGMGDPDIDILGIIGISAGRTLDMATPTVNWRASLSSSDSPFGSFADEETWYDLAEWTGTAFYIPVTGTSGAKALRLKLGAFTNAVSGMGQDRYISLSKIAVLSSTMVPYRDQIDTIAADGTITPVGGIDLKIGDRIFICNTDANYDGWHTVTAGDNTAFKVDAVTGVGPGSGYYFNGPYVDFAVFDTALATGLTTWSSAQPGGIGNSNWGLRLRPHTSRADGIEDLVATNVDPLDYGYWDVSGVPTFYCKERATPDAANDYLINASSPGIDFDVRKQAEDTPDAVKVLYQFRDVDGGTSAYSDGTVRSVYRGTSGAFTGDWTDASYFIDVWEDWAGLLLETQQAEAIGDQIIAWLGANAYAGSITIATPTIPKRGGGTKNLAYVRAGDYVGESNMESALGATTRLLITSFEMGVDGGVATLGVGEDRRDFVARITARARPHVSSPRERIGSGSGTSYRAPRRRRR